TTSSAVVATAPSGQGGQQNVEAPGIVIQPLRAGGSGGAVQAVRGAVTRTVGKIEMDQLKYYYQTVYQAHGRVPTAEEVRRDVKQADPKLSKMLDDGDIQLAPRPAADHIWAVTKFPYQ